GSYLYAYYPVIEAIASNEAVVPWFAPGDLKRVNQEYMIADQEALAPFSPVDGLRHFLISDFTKIGMGTKQRIEKAARMTGHSWWSPYWNRDVMHVSLAIPIRFRNQQYSKYLSKKLVERHIGPEIAFRGKYTFSRSIPPKVSDALKMRETVLDGTVLDQLPFRSSGAKKRMAAGIATGTHSTRKGLWHLYWLEKTLQHWDRLRAKSAL
ncbi:MAG: asparagine synthase-related protein, partial [Chloroflexi bacterium]|nr:asparagine synthase-related protein [Chloroflexota bacterium]